MQRVTGTLTPGSSSVTSIRFVGLTVTSNSHSALLPFASVAVQTTVVVPTGKRLPLGGTQTTEGEPSQPSRAVGAAKPSTAPAQPTSEGTEMSAGRAPSTGGVPSSATGSASTSEVGSGRPRWLSSEGKKPPSSKLAGASRLQSGASTSKTSVASSASAL